MTQWTQAKVESNNRRQRAATRKNEAIAVPTPGSVQEAWATYQAIEGSAWEAYDAIEEPAWKAYLVVVNAAWNEAQAQ